MGGCFYYSCFSTVGCRRVSECSRVHLVGLSGAWEAWERSSERRKLGRSIDADRFDMGATSRLAV